MKEARKLKMVERYLYGKMSVSEQAEFETLIEQDQTWYQFIERYKMVSEAIEYNLEKELIEEMTEQDMNLRLQQQTVAIRQLPLSVPQLVGMAAALMILLVALIWYGQSNYSNNALAEKYYQSPISSLSRLPTAGFAGNFADGISAFTNENWPEAIDNFAKIPASSSQYQEAQFYLGHAYYNIQDYPSALSVFETLEESDNIHEAAIEWMIILSKLKAGDRKKIILEQLDSILKNSNHPYFNNASQLKSNLESFWRLF